jgi:C_GCAxxG_C_C family probable redox protein
LSNVAQFEAFRLLVCCCLQTNSDTIRIEGTLFLMVRLDKNLKLLDHRCVKLINKIRQRTENLFMIRQLMCSEAVLTVLNQGLKGGLAPEIAVRITSGLPEGFGGSGCTCGALSAGIIALGLFLGRDGPGILNNRMVYAASRELHERFKTKFGSTCCRVLTKNIELGTKHHFEFCVRHAGEVAEQTVRIILNHEPERLELADWTYLNQTDTKMRTRIKQLSNALRS